MQIFTPKCASTMVASGKPIRTLCRYKRLAINLHFIPWTEINMISFMMYYHSPQMTSKSFTFGNTKLLLKGKKRL